MITDGFPETYYEVSLLLHMLVLCCVEDSQYIYEPCYLKWSIVLEWLFDIGERGGDTL